VRNLILVFKTYELIQIIDIIEIMPSNVYMTSSIKTSTDEIINLIIGDKWTEQVLSSTIIKKKKKYK